jgi:EamA domain-containing membrane protein RarD
MEQTVNAVPAIRSHHRVSVPFGYALNNIANLSVADTWLANRYSRFQALTGASDQTSTSFVHIANQVRFIQIAMKAAIVQRYIEIDNITVL